jgi:Ca2+/Na+ antiporter
MTCSVLEGDEGIDRGNLIGGNLNLLMLVSAIIFYESLNVLFVLSISKDIPLLSNFLTILLEWMAL